MISLALLSPILSVMFFIRAFNTGDREDIQIFYYTLIAAITVYIVIPVCVDYEIKKYNHYS
jgi:hypothetical protein